MIVQLYKFITPYTPWQNDTIEYACQHLLCQYFKKFKLNANNTTCNVWN